MDLSPRGENQPESEQGSWPAMTDFYRSGLDQSLIEENLKLSVSERMDKFASFMRLVAGVRESNAAAPRP